MKARKETGRDSHNNFLAVAVMVHVNKKEIRCASPQGLTGTTNADVAPCDGGPV